MRFQKGKFDCAMMYLIGGRREAKFVDLILLYFVSILSALLRAANNNRGNNGHLVTPQALKGSHQ